MIEEKYMFDVYVVYDPDRRQDGAAKLIGIAKNPREMMDKAEQFLKDDDCPDAVVVGVKEVGKVDIP